ncbi:MAG: ankyrin repeat domain-containing protein [Acidobacteria bacterium]|nr:ankyrin repeat domain-containing protein [Acidobacteriota bacterium]
MQLTQAVTSGDAGAVSTVLANGADVNERTGGGQTPLILATIFGHTHIIPLLLEAGADPQLRDNLGLNAVDWAHRRGATEALEMLTNKPRRRSGIEARAETRTPVQTETRVETRPTAPVRDAAPRERDTDNHRSVSQAEKSQRWLAGLKQRMEEQSQQITERSQRDVEESQNIFMRQPEPPPEIPDLPGPAPEIPDLPTPQPEIPKPGPDVPELPTPDLPGTPPELPKPVSPIPPQPQPEIPAEPPVTEPPTIQPPVTEPPVAQTMRESERTRAQSFIAPRVTDPPVTEPPVAQTRREAERTPARSFTAPRVTDPPVTGPPATHTAATEPPVVQLTPVTAATATRLPQPADEPARPRSGRKLCPKCGAIYNSELVAYCAHHFVALVDADQPPVISEPAKASPAMFWMIIVITLTGSLVVGSVITAFFYNSSGAERQAASSPATPTAVQKGTPVVGRELEGKIVSLPTAECPLNGQEAIPGTVVVRVTIDRGGQVKSATASGGDWLLRGAASEAAMKSTFAPEKLRSRETEGTITYTFEP